MNTSRFARCSIGVLALLLTVTALPIFAQRFGPPVMDITGHWGSRQHEDQFGRTQGEEIELTGRPCLPGEQARDGHCCRRRDTGGQKVRLVVSTRSSSAPCGRRAACQITPVMR
jgi:hypothetical protein